MMGPVDNLAPGPVDVLRLGCLPRDGADPVAHRGILDGEEANLRFGEPTVLVVIAEIDRVDRCFVRLKVVEEATGIVEVEDIARGRLQLGGKPRVADVHFAVPATLAVPHYRHRTFGEDYPIEPDERHADRDERIRVFSHLGIPFHPGTATVSLPVRWTALHWDVVAFRPHLAKSVPATGSAANDFCDVEA